MIYGGIVVLWLCYLVPLALRRYDEAARSRSVERFSTAMRVLGRADTVEPLVGARTLAARSRPAAPALAAADPRAQRRAAQVAARRRRRVLGVLLALTALTVGFGAFALVTWWAVAAPVALVVGFLVTARIQVARSRTNTWEQALTAGRDVAGTSADDASAEAAARMPAGRPFDDGWGDAPTEVIEAVPAADGPTPQEVVAAAVRTDDGGSLWDPLPVTLPTYVSKPRATRSVRTIDLGGPGAWTSGHLSEDEAKEAAAASSAPTEPQPARAVGD